MLTLACRRIRACTNASPLEAIIALVHLVLDQLRANAAATPTPLPPDLETLLPLLAEAETVYTSRSTFAPDSMLGTAVQILISGARAGVLFAANQPAAAESALAVTRLSCNLAYTNCPALVLPAVELALQVHAHNAATGIANVRDALLALQELARKYPLAEQSLRAYNEKKANRISPSTSALEPQLSLPLVSPSSSAFLDIDTPAPPATPSAAAPAPAAAAVVARPSSPSLHQAVSAALLQVAAAESTTDAAVPKIDTTNGWPVLYNKATCLPIM